MDLFNPSNATLNSSTSNSENLTTTGQFIIEENIINSFGSSC